MSRSEFELPLLEWGQMIENGYFSVVLFAISPMQLSGDNCSYLLRFLKNAFNLEFIKKMLDTGGQLDESILSEITQSKLIDAIIDARIARENARCEEDFIIVSRLDQHVLAIELMQDYFNTRFVQINWN